MSNEVTVANAEAVSLTERAHAIRDANMRFAKQFNVWVGIVGEQLEAARDQLSKNGSHESEFGQWVERECGMSHRHANRLIDAHRTQSVLRPIGPGKLPASESQYRELAVIPEEELPQVWQEIVDTQPAITASVIREAVAEYRTDPATDTRPHVANNSGEIEWYTPACYIEAARTAMGGIDLDPASSAIAQETVKAARWYDAEQNGLTKHWRGRIWLNPPYSKEQVVAFVAKLREHLETGDVTQAVLLVNNSTDTAWFHGIGGLVGAICFIKGRIAFHDTSNEPKDKPLQGQMCLYFGEAPEAFRDAFASFGLCFWPGDRRAAMGAA